MITGPIPRMDFVLRLKCRSCDEIFQPKFKGIFPLPILPFIKYRCPKCGSQNIKKIVKPVIKRPPWIHCAMRDGKF